VRECAIARAALSRDEASLRALRGSHGDSLGDRIPSGRQAWPITETLQNDFFVCSRARRPTMGLARSCRYGGREASRRRPAGIPSLTARVAARSPPLGFLVAARRAANRPVTEYSMSRAPQTMFEKSGPPPGDAESADRPLSSNRSAPDPRSDFPSLLGPAGAGLPVRRPTSPGAP